MDCIEIVRESRLDSCGFGGLVKIQGMSWRLSASQEVLCSVESVGVVGKMAGRIRKTVVSQFDFFLLLFPHEVRLSPFGASATNWPIVPSPDDRWWEWSSRWNENWQGKPKYSEKTYPTFTLSTTNPTWPDLCLTPGHRGGKPAINRLSYGTAVRFDLGMLYIIEINEIRAVSLLVWFQFQMNLCSFAPLTQFCLILCLILRRPTSVRLFSAAARLWLKPGVSSFQ
jgi:hypothetical protein